MYYSSIQPYHNTVVVASVDGEFTVRRLIKVKGSNYLKAESLEGSSKAIKINSDQELKIWGVCTFAIHNV